MPLLFILLLIISTTAYTPHLQSLRLTRNPTPSATTYEQETERALQPLGSISNRLSAIRSDKTTTQVLEAEKKRIQKLEDDATQKQKRAVSSGRKSAGTSVGSRGSGRRSSPHGRGYGPSRGYGSYSPFGGSRTPSFSRGFGQGPYQGGSAFGSKQPSQQSSQQASKIQRSPQTKKSSTSDTSLGYTSSKDKKKKDKKSDEKEVKENQFQQTSKKLNQDLTTIVNIISSKTKGVAPEAGLLEAYDELQRPNQNKFESFASNLSNYVKHLDGLTEDEKKKHATEMKKESSNLSKALPHLVRFSLAPNQQASAQVMSTLVNNGPRLIEEKKLKTVFEREEERLVKNTSTTASRLEHQLKNPERLSDKDKRDMSTLKQNLLSQLNTLKNNMPTEWSKMGETTSKLLKKVNDFVVPAVGGAAPAAPNPAV